MIRVLLAFHEQNSRDPIAAVELDMPGVPEMHSEMTFDDLMDAPTVEGEVWIVVRTRWTYRGGWTAYVKLWRAPWSQRKPVEEAAPIDTTLES